MTNKARISSNSTDHTPNHYYRAAPNTLVSLDIPRGIIRDLHPAARAHRTSVSRFVQDILRVLAREPSLARAIFDED
jgi:hypothetical protein